MFLKTIKSHKCNDEFVKRIFKSKELIKEKVGIDKAETMFYIGYFYFGEIFLHNKKLYIFSTNFEYDSQKKIIIDKISLAELYEITLLKDYPKTVDDIECKTILSKKNSKFNIDNFLFWIDEPCTITEEIHNPFYEVLQYLNNYSKETFKTKRYLFYSKPDDDYHWVINIYAYDIKNNTEIKLYVAGPWSKEKQRHIEPLNLQEIAVDKLDGRFSTYQIRDCKKAFLKLINEENATFKKKNFWVMELIKQAIQPTAITHIWSVHKCFGKIDFWGYFFIQDNLAPNEEPYFFITDRNFTKVAMLKFKQAEYFKQDIYVKGINKAKQWILSEKEIEELIEFFNKPSNRLGQNLYYGYFDKYVKTNWQQLLFEYNQNTAGWGWGETGFKIPPEKDTNREIDAEALPFDLPIPDYRQLHSSC